MRCFEVTSELEPFPRSPTVPLFGVHVVGRPPGLKDREATPLDKGIRDYQVECACERYTLRGNGGGTGGTGGIRPREWWGTVKGENPIAERTAINLIDLAHYEHLIIRRRRGRNQRIRIRSLQ